MKLQTVYQNFWQKIVTSLPLTCCQVSKIGANTVTAIILTQAVVTVRIVEVVAEVLTEGKVAVNMIMVTAEVLMKVAATVKIGVVVVEVLMEVAATPKVVAADLTSLEMTTALKKLKKQSVVPPHSNEVARTTANQINSEKSSQDLIVNQASLTGSKQN